MNDGNYSWNCKDRHHCIYKNADHCREKTCSHSSIMFTFDPHHNSTSKTTICCLELISLSWIQNRLFSIWESWNKSHSCCHVVKFLSCCHVVKVKRKKRREFQKMRIWRILLEKLLWRGITCFIYDIWEILDGYFIS